ncbi:MAG: DUF3788 domain-containing protein [Bacteroidales bacterium]|jgi:hypothetical protein|nr:DUF3788 domain-containing protein [Bacteroidales bacterium]
MKSVFTDKGSEPKDECLKVALGATYEFWQTFVDYVHAVCPKSIDEWSFSKSGGWSFRLKDNRRAIIYLLPRDGFFKVAFVFGQKATDGVFKSEVATAIRTELESAKAYAEGRGIRVEVKDGGIINDIKNLINIKLEN